MVTWGDPPIPVYDAPTVRVWFFKLETTFSFNYITIQPLKHTILWETLPLEFR